MESWYGYRNGWPGVPGVRLPLSSCGCNDFPAQPCGPAPCGPNGCPILLDTSCVIYHQFGTSASRLTNLNLPNGSSAQLIFETIDSQLANINVTNWALPVLRTIYGTVTSLQQFGQDVDTQIGLINTAITNLQNTAAVPITSTPTPSITFVLSGILDHNVSANVNVSAASGNDLSINPDGLFSAPQSLSINYTNKTLSISNGNTVNLASLICGVSGFLGDVTTDPAPVVDGQYWYNTTTSQLKMQLNGATRVITIT